MRRAPEPAAATCCSLTAGSQGTIPGRACLPVFQGQGGRNYPSGLVSNWVEICSMEVNSPPCLGWAFMSTRCGPWWPCQRDAPGGWGTRGSIRGRRQGVSSVKRAAGCLRLEQTGEADRSDGCDAGVVCAQRKASLPLPVFQVSPETDCFLVKPSRDIPCMDKHTCTCIW